MTHQPLTEFKDADKVKITLEVEQDDQLIVIEGWVDAAKIEANKLDSLGRPFNDSDEWWLKTGQYEISQVYGTEYVLKLKANSKGEFMTVQQRESPAYKSGYERGRQDERKRVKALLDE